MKKWVPKELVDYTMGTTYENYPKDEVIDKTKLFILDNIGSALGGQPIYYQQSRSQSIYEHGQV